MLDELPLELISLIALIDAAACTHIWFFNPRFRDVFDARKSRELFITRDHGTTKVLGMIHSIDGEAAMISPGIHSWYYRGKPGREHGLPTDVYTNGTLKWYDKNYNLHRVGGFAVIYASGRGEIWRDGHHIA